MADWVEFTAKTVDEALTEALIQMETTSDKVAYEVIDNESNGFFGLFSRQAKIKVKKKENAGDTAKSFLSKIFDNMGVNPNINVTFEEAESVLNIEVEGDNTGMLIGKRGQTLDALQYLTSLVVNRESDKYIKIKLDTENYRERRKETIENLAKNLASKVKKTRKPSFLEPMNPYERRIIHSVLQENEYVETHSEGDDPNRKVVITPSKKCMDTPRRENHYRRNRTDYRNDKRKY